MTELNLTLRALHLLGAILWIGGAVAVALSAAAVARDAKDGAAASALRRVALRVATPGMVLAWAGGLTLLVMGWAGYQRAGWMHAKLLFVLVAAGLTGVLSARLRRWAAGGELAVASVRGLAYGLLGLALLVLFMVFWGPLLMGGTD